MAVVIHRGSPRWFEIRGRRYEVVSGGGRGWGYIVWSDDGPDVDDFTDLDDVRQWAQDWIDHPEWGNP